MAAHNEEDCKRHIVEVWSYNIYDEFNNMLQLVEDYPFVAMDTEYPGTFLINADRVHLSGMLSYPIIATNVNVLKIIQIGISFFDKNGKTPEGRSSWEFNFKFVLEHELYSDNSISMLSNSGFVFTRHATEGIDPNVFAELMYSSGLLMNPKIRWITFHGSADFAYLVKLLTNTYLPLDEQDFFTKLNIFFPRLYDIKFILRFCKPLYGGLQLVADSLKIGRIGEQHHAGSDSLVTGKVFFCIIEQFFDNIIEDHQLSGQLYGFSQNSSFMFTQGYCLPQFMDEFSDPNF